MKPGVTVTRQGLSLVAAALAVVGCASTDDIAKTHYSWDPDTDPYVAPAAATSYSQASLMGPAGPAGPAGEQGLIGYTGAPGDALTGPRGAEGHSGPRGERGLIGPTGAEGAVAVGQAGVAGPAGAAGVQGERGLTGAQGASLAGYAGRIGPAGPSGPQGERGATGIQGTTLFGPRGPAGPQGPTGVQGEVGATGLQGSTTAGLAGSSGEIGAVGEQGAIGPTGDQGPAGVIQRWMTYREFWFESGETELWSNDWDKVLEVATYMKRNPSLHIGIDNFGASRDQNQRALRVNAVRNALMQAGIPENRIEVGDFGTPLTRRDSRVELLIATGPVS